MSLPKRTTVSLSPYNMKRISELIEEVKPVLGPRINFSIVIEEAINISWESIVHSYREKIPSKKFKELK